MDSSHRPCIRVIKFSGDTSHRKTGNRRQNFLGRLCVGRNKRLTRGDLGDGARVWGVSARKRGFRAYGLGGKRDEVRGQGWRRYSPSLEGETWGTASDLEGTHI